MAKKTGASSAKTSSVQAVTQRAQKLADELSLELVEVTLQKESRGKCLCVYADKKGGMSLDDCERFHRALQPLLDDIDYDIMEVSSPGVDRPIKNQRDFERNAGGLVEVKLFAPKDGCKLYTGTLQSMDDAQVTIESGDGQALTFERKAVALVKPVIHFDEDDLPAEGEVSEDDFSDMELE